MTNLPKEVEKQLNRFLRRSVQTNELKINWFLRDDITGEELLSALLAVDKVAEKRVVEELRTKIEEICEGRMMETSVIERLKSLLDTYSKAEEKKHDNIKKP